MNCLKEEENEKYATVPCQIKYDNEIKFSTIKNLPWIPFFHSIITNYVKI